MYVSKEMTVDDLKSMFEPEEALDRTVFDPREHSFFTLENGLMTFSPNAKKSNYQMTGEAYLILGQMLGIPRAYAQSTPHDLMLPHMNHWLAHKGIGELTFASDGNVIQSFSKGSMLPISNGKILDAVKKLRGSDLSIHHVSHDVNATTFSILDTSHEWDAASGQDVGDVLQVGVTVENSYALTRPLTISTYVHRLICANGAISTDNVFRYSRYEGEDGEGDDSWIDIALTEAFEAADKEIERVRALSQIKMEGHLSDVLASIYTNYSVPTGIRETITDTVMDQRVDTLYGLYNVVTDIASNDEDVLEDSALSMRLMRMGGTLAAHPDMCPSCYRLVN